MFGIMLVPIFILCYQFIQNIISNGACLIYDQESNSYKVILKISKCKLRDQFIIEEKYFNFEFLIGRSETIDGNLVHQIAYQSLLGMIRGRSRAATTSKMERFVIIVNSWYQKALHLGCCSSPRPPLIILGMKLALIENLKLSRISKFIGIFIRSKIFHQRQYSQKV